MQIVVVTPILDLRNIRKWYCPLLISDSGDGWIGLTTWNCVEHNCSGTAGSSQILHTIRNTRSLVLVSCDMSAPPSLLSLPRELRLQIFGFALQLAAGDRRIGPQRSNSRGLPLLLVCRFITHEVIPLVYSASVFHFAYPATVLNWLNVIGSNLVMIRRVSVLVEAAPPARNLWFQVFEKLSDARSLWWLRIHFNEHATHHGLGRDDRLLQLLARFDQLQTLELAGHCASSWPRILQRSTGATVIKG